MLWYEAAAPLRWRQNPAEQRPKGKAAYDDSVHLPSLFSDMASAAFLPFLPQSSKSGPEMSQITGLLHVIQSLCVKRKELFLT